ncbi:biotin synthase BioB [Peptoniphilus equinus]|uniref:Biotin synthase n=1 Tax=Peptoniphilus equinus TaxID=3016343 RepID=A0ABY7QSM1_9FIRM|nr:biotin synthase BioB [Peptoniphilus equinus]WBW49737.1 biotin synthase BioB [Peptoniphilus equinus]
MDIFNLKDSVIAGYDITKDEALVLYDSDYEDLKACADAVRRHYMGDRFEFCTVINAKSGKCSEDCKFCAQSAHWSGHAEVYDLLDGDVIVADARRQKELGMGRYSLVTSGKRLSDAEVDLAVRVIRRIIEEVGMDVCVSFGLLDEANYQKLYDAGVRRVHNNVESSRNFFERVCSTHSFDEKLAAIEAAHRVGMEICSGGIIGLGESRSDRVDMAFEIKNLPVVSVPVNVLNPISGTPFGGNTPLTTEEINRTMAVYRFILKDVYLRLAGGRSVMADYGRESLTSGANAAISGTLLTTQGMHPTTDIAMVTALGFQIH